MSPLGVPAGQADPPNPSLSEEKVRALVERFSDALRCGEAPDLFDWLLSHPDLAAELEPRLVQVQQLFERVRVVESLPAGQAPPSDDLPCWVGRYRIDGLLGQGNQAIVFRAHDPKFDRPVALKVLHPSQATSRGYLQRFHHSAKVVARLRHPNIVEIHDAGEDAGFHYIDMLLVEGETLQQHLQRQAGTRPPYRTSAELIYEIAQALHHAHEHGIVHRDVKPANILLQAGDGTTPTTCNLDSAVPLLTDFGLARHLDREATQSRPGTVVGTLAYMAPEQAEGHSHEADPRSDVYAVGAVLHELLTGHWPFQDSATFAVLTHRKLHDDPVPLRRLDPDVPRDLETICLRALERDPARRFPTAQAMAEELWRWLHDEPLTIRPPTRLEKARRWARRNRAATVSTAALAGTLVVTAVVVGWRQAERALEAQVRQRLESENAELRDKALREYETSRLHNVAQRMQRPTQGRRREALGELAEVIDNRRRAGRPRIDAVVRSLYAAALALPDMAEIGHVEFKNDPFTLLQASLHPDGDRMVLGTAGGPLAWKLGEPLRLTDDRVDGQGTGRVQHSPDGNYLAHAPREGGLSLRAADQVSRVLHERRTRPLLAMRFERTGAALWAVSDEGQVQRWTVPDLRADAGWRMPGPPARLSAAAISEDLGSIAVGDSSGRTLLLERDGRERKALAGSPVAVEALAWSGDGSHLAIGARDGMIELVDRTGHRLRSFNLGGNGVGQILFSPNGQWLLAGQRGSRTLVWDVVTGEQVLDASVIPWSFARDGSGYAASAVGRVCFGRIERPVAAKYLRGHQVGVQQIVWSRDNRHLASLDASGEIRAWDVEREVAVDHLRAPAGTFYGTNSGLALSDDARWLAYASGGASSVLWLRDVQAKTEPRKWDLPTGFDRLACTGGDRFRSVREEEDEPRSERWQTVARELDPVRGLGPCRVIRPHRQGDVRFHGSQLSADGRRYFWLGPRLRVPGRVRTEVYDVARGEAIFRNEVPHARPHRAADAQMADDGSWLWSSGGDHGAPGVLHDLTGRNPPLVMPSRPMPSPDGRWRRTMERDEFRNASLYCLTPSGVEAPWLFLPIEYTAPRFSADSRRFAASTPGGTIVVIDLAALKEDVDAFERAELAR